MAQLVQFVDFLNAKPYPETTGCPNRGVLVTIISELFHKLIYAPAENSVQRFPSSVGKLNNTDLIQTAHPCTAHAVHAHQSAELQSCPWHHCIHLKNIAPNKRHSGWQCCEHTTAGLRVVPMRWYIPVHPSCVCLWLIRQGKLRF